MTSDAGGFDLDALLEQAQSMQQQMMEAQAEQSRSLVVGTAGGGMVSVEANGLGEFRRVKINPDAVDPDDVELLEELLLAALHDLSTKISQAGAESLGGLSLPGLGDSGGLGDIGKMLGGG